VDAHLVGRRRELEALTGWVAAARAGRGRLVLCAGEPGIGKTRLAQELAAHAAAHGVAVAWGRCAEVEGAPAYWPWRQVLRALGVDDALGGRGGLGSAEERFQLFDGIADALRAQPALLVVLDDVHRADEPSLLALRHLADRLADAHLLVLATFRDTEPADALRRALPELLRAGAVERLDLRGFDLDDIRGQLADPAQAPRVLDVTGGNPLFVREVARAIADGMWRPDRPPATVRDVVAARLERVSEPCRTFVRAAAVVGRDFALGLVAATLAAPVVDCLPAVDEAVAWGLVEELGPDYRFCHALTRDAVAASLTTAERAVLHRRVAEAIAARNADDLAEHLPDLARHWAELAPFGEGETARRWALAAAEDAVGRLAYEEGVRLYRSAVAVAEPGWPAAERCRVLVALGRAALLSGDLPGGVAAAREAARWADTPELTAEAALVLEAVPDPSVNALATQLCEAALAELGEHGDARLRARLLAQRSHLAFYDGEQERVEELSATALAQARASADDDALVSALRARQEACPGPSGREERLALGAEMVTLAARLGSPRTAMWGRLWRVEAMIEAGRLADAADELGALGVAVERVGGPVSAWHRDRVAACIAQAQGRYAEAAETGRRGFVRMRAIERAPATGAYFALQTALAGHAGVSAEAEAFLGTFQSPPRFRTIQKLSQAVLLLAAGRAAEADASYRQAGPLGTWSLPAFFVLPGYVYATLVTAQLGRVADLASLLDRLAPHRAEHAIGGGVAYLGPVALAMGRGAVALGRRDRGVEHLSAAAALATTIGAPGYVAEADYHLATALLARGGPGDRDRARSAAAECASLVAALGMTAYAERAAELSAQLAADPVLSPREEEVAALVAEGLTNRQIAQRLVISERTAQNHVQHILTKLGFATRGQIAAWRVSSR
jgi:DNA-binding CsgD family transcriptional regulator